MQCGAESRLCSERIACRRMQKCTWMPSTVHAVPSELKCPVNWSVQWIPVPGRVNFSAQYSKFPTAMHWFALFPPPSLSLHSSAKQNGALQVLYTFLVHCTIHSYLVHFNAFLVVHCSAFSVEHCNALFILVAQSRTEAQGLPAVVSPPVQI